MAWIHRLFFLMVVLFCRTTRSEFVAPVILIQFGNCAEASIVEQAAVTASRVYYVSELNCNYVAPDRTEIIHLNLDSLSTQDVSPELER